MSLNLKDEDIVNLVTEVARLANETKTEAVRRSLEERRERLLRRSRRQPLTEFLERQVWPLVPTDVLGTIITREEEDLIPGYGPDGF